MSQTTPPSIAEQLRAAIRESGMTYQQIAEKAFVGKPTISAYMSRLDKDLNTATAEKIAKAIGFRLVIRKE
jgi:transcriptional regulator with XRE-family HTH domain